MNVGGVTSNYPVGYEARKTQKTTSEQIFTLHCLNNESGEKPIGAKGLENGGSTTVYKPTNFDSANPVYKVRIWDATFFRASCFKQVMENPSNPSGSQDNCLDKHNWVNIVKDAMQMQYDAGNLVGYLDYKKFWDFLTQ